LSCIQEEKPKGGEEEIGEGSSLKMRCELLLVKRISYAIVHFIGD